MKKSVIVSGMPSPDLSGIFPFQVNGKIEKTDKNKFGVNPYDDEEIGYYRVSTGRDQDPQYQIDLLKRHGVPEANIFGDIGSGVKRRKKFEFVLKMLAGRPGWTLVVWKIDRMGRDAAELLALMKLFVANNWNLVSLTEGVDTRTPMGRFCFGVMALIAQHERDLIIERTRAGTCSFRPAYIRFRWETVVRDVIITYKDGKRVAVSDLPLSEIQRLMTIATDMENTGNSSRTTADLSDRLSIELLIRQRHMNKLL